MRRAFPILFALTLLAAACGGSSGTEPTAAPPTTAAATTTAAPTTVAAAPMSAVSAVLDGSYNTAGEFDAATMGFDVGDVTAEWYQAEGFYVVIYRGLDLDATGPLCPGNSIFVVDGGYEFVSNAPTPGADCSSFGTLTTDPDVGPLICDGVVSYRTAIPAGTEGDLFGTVERPVDGGIMGITSVAFTGMGEIPEVELASLSC